LQPAVAEVPMGARSIDGRTYDLVVVDEAPDETPLEQLLAAGRKLIDEARRTSADLDAAMNTAVVPVIRPDEASPPE
jgi:hypothetical protein